MCPVFMRNLVEYDRSEEQEVMDSLPSLERICNHEGNRGLGGRRLLDTCTMDTRDLGCRESRATRKTYATQ